MSKSDESHLFSRQFTIFFGICGVCAFFYCMRLAVLIVPIIVLSIGRPFVLP